MKALDIWKNANSTLRIVVVLALIGIASVLLFRGGCGSPEPTLPELNTEQTDSLQAELDFMKGKSYSDSIATVEAYASRDSAIIVAQEAKAEVREMTANEKHAYIAKELGVAVDAAREEVEDSMANLIADCNICEADLAGTKSILKRRTIELYDSKTENEVQEAIMKLQGEDIQVLYHYSVYVTGELKECKKEKKGKFWKGFWTGLGTAVATAVATVQITK